MRHDFRRRGLSWLGALALCTASGCVVPEYFTFAKHFNEPNPAQGPKPPGIAGAPCPPGGLPNPNQPALAGGAPPMWENKAGIQQAGGIPKPLSPDLYNPPPPPPGPPPYEMLSVMSQRLALAEDDAQVAKARLQQLEGDVQERNQALNVAQTEIEAARQSMIAADEELARQRKSMENLRVELKKLEVENKSTLETVIRLLEEMIEPKKKE